jgi:hypothetical protein
VSLHLLDELNPLPLSLFNPRFKSLARGNTVVLGSVVLAALLSHAPRPNLWVLVPAVLVIVGAADTVRNIRPRWSFYHAGVMLCLYMDLMAITLVYFFLLYPYLDLGVHAFRGVR